MTDEEVRIQAIEFAKKNKEKIAKKLTDPNVYAPSRFPISVFMAGSPGAGKTEYSKNLIEILEKNKERRVVRIDPDDVRSLIPGYTGSNSNLFQGAASLIVEKMHDQVLHRGQHFILDGTLANYEKAKDNIRRSLEHKRIVLIFYLFQKPEIAWKFTIAREKKEGRNIPKSAFIEQFLSSHKTVNEIRKEYGREVSIYLVKTDYEKNTVEKLIEITPRLSIDEYLEMKYTGEVIERLL
ncbi:MAG TPA: zeta toxin family protein [Patescibacteria group bacterium]